MAPSRHDWKIVDRDVKPQHNQPTLRRDSDFSHQKQGATSGASGEKATSEQLSSQSVQEKVLFLFALLYC